MNRLLLASFVLFSCIVGISVFRPVFGAEEPDPKATKEADAAKRIDLADWVSEDEKYSNPIEAQTVDEGDKGKQLKISYKGGEKDKAVVCKTIDKLKLSAKGTLRFKALNPNEKAVQVTVALKTGKNWAFHESQRISLKPGEKDPQDVSIDLTASTFKSEATEWKNTGAIADPTDLRTLQIGIYNDKESGSLIITDLEIVAKP